MKNTKLTAAVLALIAAVAFTPSAKANQAAGTGDLILGMYDTSNTVTNSYEVSLGLFNSLSYGETWNLSSDISSVFSNTPSDSDLVWTVFGTATPGAADGIAAKGVDITSNGAITTNSSSGPSSRISSTWNPINNGAKLTDGGVSYANSNANSYEAELNAAPGSFDLGNFAPDGVTTVYNSANSAGLYAVLNGTAGTPQELGVFSFNTSTGVLTYSAVPEPSTYALMGLGMLAFVWMLKRRASMMV